MGSDVTELPVTRLEKTRTRKKCGVKGRVMSCEARRSIFFDGALRRQKRNALARREVSLDQKIGKVTLEERRKGLVPWYCEEEARYDQWAVVLDEERLTCQALGNICQEDAEELLLHAKTLRDKSASPEEKLEACGMSLCLTHYEREDELYEIFNEFSDEAYNELMRIDHFACYGSYESD